MKKHDRDFTHQLELSVDEHNQGGNESKLQSSKSPIYRDESERDYWERMYELEKKNKRMDVPI